MPKLLGIDPGQRWVGLATSDESKSIASPFTVLDRNQGDSELLDQLHTIVEDESISGIVVGYPDPLKVDENERTRQVDNFIRTLVEPLPAPHQTISERYSTKQARRKREEREESGEPDDDEAAAVILQTYIDRNSEPSSDRRDSTTGHE